MFKFEFWLVCRDPIWLLHHSMALPMLLWLQPWNLAPFTLPSLLLCLQSHQHVRCVALTSVGSTCEAMHAMVPSFCLAPDKVVNLHQNTSHGCIQAFACAI